MKLNCLRTEIRSGSATYPVYIGFGTAAELTKIAEAPSFDESTPNATIATNVLTPPVHSWQRPLIDWSIKAIEITFDDSGRLMPNSVLLAKNPLSGTPLVPKQQTVGGQTPTDIWEIDVPAATAGQPKPLWILDGQHRIHGMSRSAQRDNPLPLVLLLNEDSTSYSESRLAEIFAQVTTTAASLDKLHHEWMAFAFRLGKYADNAADPHAQRAAMETAAIMCKNPQLDAAGKANPFRDKIKFNPKLSPSGFPHGFAYDAVEMQKLLYRAYFAAVPVAGVAKLLPGDLARELGLAYLALKSSVKAPQDQTVFFGSTTFSQRVMQDAFFVGVCTRLLQHTLPINWAELLKNLKFPTSNWNFKSWVRSMSGTDQTTSKLIAEKVFRKAFTDGAVSGQADIVDILKGNGAQFDVIVEALKANGRADHALTETRTLTKGNSLSVSSTSGVKRRVKIRKTSNNIGKIETIDVTASTAARRVKLNEIKSSSGLVLDPQATPQVHKAPLSVSFEIHLYGGIQGEADLEIDWM